MKEYISKKYEIVARLQLRGKHFEFWLPIRDFFDKMELQIMPGETTENTGAASGNISTATYYVEEDI